MLVAPVHGEDCVLKIILLIVIVFVAVLVFRAYKRALDKCPCQCGIQNRKTW